MVACRFAKAASYWYKTTIPHQAVETSFDEEPCPSFMPLLSSMESLFSNGGSALVESALYVHDEPTMSKITDSVPRACHALPGGHKTLAAREEYARSP